MLHDNRTAMMCLLSLCPHSAPQSCSSLGILHQVKLEVLSPSSGSMTISLWPPSHNLALHAMITN